MSCYLCCCIDEHLLPSISPKTLEAEKYNEVEDQSHEDLNSNQGYTVSNSYQIPIDIENCSRKNKQLLQSSPSYREAVRGNVTDISLNNSR